jgi:hypothetical protein
VDERGKGRLNILTVTKDQARKVFEALLDDLQHACQHLRFARAYRTLVQEFKTEIKKTPELWNWTYWAHVDAAIFRLCRIYDTTGLSLESLLQEIERNGAIYDAKKLKEHYAKLPRGYQRKIQEIKPKPISTDIQMVSSYNPLVRTLREWRNKRFSHKTSPDIYEPGKLSRDFPLRIMDLETLQEVGLRILNYYGEIVFNMTGQVTGEEEGNIRLIFESVKSSSLTMDSIRNSDKQLK